MEYFYIVLVSIRHFGVISQILRNYLHYLHFNYLHSEKKRKRKERIKNKKKERMKTRFGEKSVVRIWPDLARQCEFIDAREPGSGRRSDAHRDNAVGVAGCHSRQGYRPASQPEPRGSRSNERISRLATRSPALSSQK